MSITRHHNEWLALVPNSGPFVSLLVATQAFPQGLDVHDVEHARRLRQAFEEWDEDQSGKRPDPTLHRAWIQFVLRETLGYDRAIAEGQAIPQTLRSEVAEHGETLRPDWVLFDPETKKARLLIQTWPRSQALNKPSAASRWKASPDTRMTQLLRDTESRLGLVTNGDHWMLVTAPPNETSGYASWYAHLWLEEPITLRAFRTLLSAERFFGVAEKDTVEALLDRSASDQQEVTDQLGYQVRKAVEVVIQALDKADQDHGRKLLADVDEKTLYEAALTVMMRLVFLFCAEERALLLLGDDLWDRNYAVSTLREQLRVAADQHGEEILGFRHDAWARLLTTFRAVYGGVKHDRFKLPAYGGSLFNPDRFPFLEGRKKGTSWKDAEAAPLPVSNRTVLHLLEALQVLQVRLPGGGPSEARNLSFRSLDIEQIGHVYEGLLDHTAKRAQEPVLGLRGTGGKEPEIPLSELEGIAAKGEDELVAHLKDETGRSESALRKALHTEIDAELASRFRTACQHPDLWERTAPLAWLVREDSTGYPVVITPGSVFVTKGTDRRSTGTHYTPKSLTEPIVLYTLEPLVYVGPAEGLPKEQWRLRPAKELLDLKICDMACGSGAFLVQACRYMAARLLEAWDEVQRANPGTFRVTPEGEFSTGQPGEMLIPDDPDERQTYALRIVAQRCLYGVDKNPLAAEMAKLSLWLLTLAKDKPFEFLDHAIRCGDSLVGIHNLDQLRKFNLDGQGETSPLFLGFLDEKIKEAIDLRRRLAAMQANVVADVEVQERMLREADERTDLLRAAADLLIAAEFVPGSTWAKQAATEGAAPEIAAHIQDGDLRALRREVDRALGSQPTFHWPLEFPEVIVERGGFDACVSNPPFITGKRISTTLGAPYETFLKSVSADSVGAADICVFFLRRAFSLSAQAGSVGMIGTKSIAEGDSREVGTIWLLGNGAEFYWAWHELPWPGNASVTVSLLTFRCGPWHGSKILNGNVVGNIGSKLTEAVGAEPFTLQQNKGLCSDGIKVQGDGFIVDDALRREMLMTDPRNATVLRPYITGMDIAQGMGSIPHAWIICFDTMSHSEACSYRAPFAVVTKRVKPYRESLSGQIHEPDFWKFWDKREEFFLRMRGKGRILACPSTAKYLLLVFLREEWIASHSVKLFSFDDWRGFAVMQSGIHEAWAREQSGKLEQRLAYNLTKAFATFPWPSGAVREEIAEKLYTAREEIRATRSACLTDVYNCLHDPTETSDSIQRLRAVQAEMDNEVAAAYGWNEIDLGHGFRETKQGIRYTLSEVAHHEVLAQLLKLNHERFEEEFRRGLHNKKKAKGGKTRKQTARSDDGPRLFE